MENRINKVIVVLIISLLVSFILIYFLMINSDTAIVKDNVIYADEVENKTIELYKEHECDGDRFITPFMFPGDSTSKVYQLEAYYKGDIKIYYRIYDYDSFYKLMDIQYDKNRNVVKEYGPRIRVIIDGEEYYRGFVVDLPESFVIERSAKGKTAEKISYKLILSYDKEVDSDYTLDSGMYQGEVAHFDMEWWVEGGTPYKPPITGVDGVSEVINNPNTYVLIIAGVSVICIVFLARRKKDYE